MRNSHALSSIFFSIRRWHREMRSHAPTTHYPVSHRWWKPSDSSRSRQWLSSFPSLEELPVPSRDWRLPAMAEVSFLKSSALASSQCGAHALSFEMSKPLARSYPLADRHLTFEASDCPSVLWCAVLRLDRERTLGGACSQAKFGMNGNARFSRIWKRAQRYAG